MMKRTKNDTWAPVFKETKGAILKPFNILFLIAVLLFLPFGSHLVCAEKMASGQKSALSPLAMKALMLDAAAKGGHVVCVGERGYILVSDDDGKNWRQVEGVPTRATLTGVYLHDEKLGWAVGHDAVILRTTDGGKAWESVFSDPALEMPLLDVWFKDARNGFAIGAYGLFMVTTDGGSTWSRRKIGEDDYHLNHISASQSGKLYLSAESGKVYRSDDGGEVWQILSLPYEGSIFCTLPLKGEAVLAFGLRGNAFRSTDSGASWTKIDTGLTAMLNDAQVLRDGRIVVCGLGGALIESRDEGKSFQSIEKKSGRQGISKILEAKGAGLLLFGEFGVQTMSLTASNT